MAHMSARSNAKAKGRCCLHVQIHVRLEIADQAFRSLTNARFAGTLLDDSGAKKSHSMFDRRITTLGRGRVICGGLRV